MVFILAASSLHHAIETVIPENQNALKEKVHSIPGLSLNINAKNPRKIVQNLIEKDFNVEKELIFGTTSLITVSVNIKASFNVPYQ